MKFERRFNFPKPADGKIRFVVTKCDIRGEEVFVVGFPEPNHLHAVCTEKMIRDRGGTFHCAGTVERSSNGILTLVFNSESCKEIFGRSMPIPTPDDWGVFIAELRTFLHRYVKDLI